MKREWSEGQLQIISAIGCNIIPSVMASMVWQDFGWKYFLTRPPFEPPAWIFGPVWFVLYSLMGIVLGTILKRGSTLALTLFTIQFIINATWMPLFIIMRDIGWSLVQEWILVLFIAMTMFCLYNDRLNCNITRIGAISAWKLFIPYILWASFAVLLTSTLYLLNP